MNKNWIITKRKYLNKDEVKKLRKTCEDAAIVAEHKSQLLAIRDWMIIDLALSTGLRVSEIANLEVKDVFISKNEAELIVQRGKGGKGRVVRFDPSLKTHLRKYIKWKRSKKRNGVYLFFSDQRANMCVESYENVFKKYTRKAMLSAHYTFHCMRHTHATFLYEKTLDLRLVQKQLGHSSPVITQLYADVLNESQDQAFSNPMFS